MSQADGWLLAITLALVAVRAWDQARAKRLRRRVNALENALLMLTLEFAKRAQKQGEG